MNFQSLISSPAYKQEPDSFSSTCTDSYLSPPPSPKSPLRTEENENDEFQESLKFNTPASPFKVKLPFNNSKLVNSKDFPTWFTNEKHTVSPESSASVSKLSKEKLYPNWFKGLNDAKPNSESPRKKKKSPLVKKNGYATHCHLCNNSVRFESLQQHLYFGFVKCEDCDRVVTSCLKFCNLSNLTTKENGNCTHAVLDWVLPPVDNLKRLWDEEESTFTDSLTQYIKSLNALKNIQPYKKAITYCNNYLKEKKYSSIKEKSFEDEDLATSPIASPTSSIPTNIISTNRKKLKAKTRHVRKKQSEGDEGPILPKDGSYLILRKPIEECPDCYETFDPKNLKFNTSNWLISLKCKSCQLLVCFILDPPDGSDSKLTIINGL
ncbi:UNVERIFIED_CONTAM: hypothetical protein RMT77_003082 [Armadillidium vulgare]